MRIVLVLLTLNHLIYLSFECLIESVMSNASTAGRAPGYGIVYGLLIFPVQFLAELVLFVALLYQVLVVRQSQVNVWYWSCFVLTLFLVLDSGY